MHFVCAMLYWTLFANLSNVFIDREPDSHLTLQNLNENELSSAFVLHSFVLQRKFLLLQQRKVVFNVINFYQFSSLSHSISFFCVREQCDHIGIVACSCMSLLPRKFAAKRKIVPFFTESHQTLSKHHDYLPTFRAILKETLIECGKSRAKE